MWYVEMKNSSANVSIFWFIENSNKVLLEELKNNLFTKLYCIFKKLFNFVLKLNYTRISFLINNLSVSLLSLKGY